jgi:hypothetical protein
MRRIAVLSGFFLFIAAAFGADPQLMNLVMPDAKILGGINVTSARNSAFGQFIISRIPASDQHLQAFIDATGFDPRRDAAEVLAATAGNPSKPGGLLLVRGNFSVDQITAAASAHLPPIQVQTYDGATLITGTNQRSNSTHALAFIGNSIAVAGEVSDVKAALDRSQGANSIDSALAAEVASLSANQDEWVVSSVPLASLLPASNSTPTGPAAQVLQVLKGVQSFNGGVKFGSTIQATAQAQETDANNAAALGAVVKLLIALASTNSSANPQLGAVLPLIQNVQISTEGAAVNLALAIPEDQVEAVLTNLPQHPKQTSPRRRPARLEPR